MRVELPIQRIDSRTLRQSDIEEFLPALREPVVLTHLDFAAPSWDDFCAALGDEKIYGYPTGSIYYGAWMPAQEYLAAWRRGDAVLNVIDHPFHSAALQAMFPLPAVLRQGNYIYDDPGIASAGCTMLMSVAGAYSGYHVDTYGMGGWMYLVEGEKEWEIMEPSYFSLVYNPISRSIFDPVLNPPSRHWNAAIADVIANIPVRKTTLRAGELLINACGCPHRVATTQRSFGFGGSYINRAGVADSARHWVCERSLGVSGPYDFVGMLKLAQSVRTDARDQEAIAAALQIVAHWEESLSRWKRDRRNATEDGADDPNGSWVVY